MSDMRYDLRISAHEILGMTQVLVEVWTHPHDYSQRSERAYRRLFDVGEGVDSTIERWVRDVLVGVAEHL